MANISIFDIKEKSGKIYLIGRDEHRERKIITDTCTYSPFHGMFFVKKNCVDILDDFADIIEVNLTLTEKRSIFGDELMQVRYKIINFDRVKELRHLIEEYREVIFEGDLWGRTLYCLDTLPTKGYDYNGDWRIGYIDIETEVMGGMSDSNNPTDRVLCLTCYDNYTKEYHFFYFGDEVIESQGDIRVHRYTKEMDMLTGIMEWMSKKEFDVVTGA